MSIPYLEPTYKSSIDQFDLLKDLKEATDIEETLTSRLGTKRRAEVSRAGTRSIASLTPEQLSRKRANDRTAQVRSSHLLYDEWPEAWIIRLPFLEFHNEEYLRANRTDYLAGQRSIRQRTKKHIEELEQRIRDLSQDQDVRDFEQIKRRNAELEEELRQLSELLGRSQGSMVSSPDLNPLSGRIDNTRRYEENYRRGGGQVYDPR
ncbi:uncharacterized protein RSE6_14276 [Rhynchosporium secalis]|uniref:BZIP domain-containing protein n=1 Tax=Rhynchosporium secalis TaxID=38038 RepID=A0A1E1MUZ4_RHYSE|nr:uncharacterized protein RSE6_14276 [Rhynchosporium secalis]